MCNELCTWQAAWMWYRGVEKSSPMKKIFHIKQENESPFTKTAAPSETRKWT